MVTFSERLLGNVAQVSAALELEPGIRLNLVRADLRTIVRVMYAVMLKGGIGATALYRYLESRRCQLDRAAIDFLLDSHEGEDPDHHLWAISETGEYWPLIEFAPPGGSIDTKVPSRSSR